MAVSAFLEPIHIKYFIEKTPYFGAATGLVRFILGGVTPHLHNNTTRARERHHYVLATKETTLGYVKLLSQMGSGSNN